MHVRRILSFYGRCLAVALRHPWSVSDTVSSILGLLLPLIGRFHPAWQPAMTQLVWQIPLGLFAGLSSVRLLFAPYWVYEERDRKASSDEAALRAELSRAQAIPTREMRNAVAKSRVDGIELMNRLVDGDEQFEVWNRNLDDWYAATCEALKHFDEASLLSFKHLGTLMDASYSQAFHASHNSKLLALSERIRILEEISRG